MSELRDRGASIDTVLCVVDRRRDGEQGLLDDAELTVLSLFSSNELG